MLLHFVTASAYSFPSSCPSLLEQLLWQGPSICGQWAQLEAILCHLDSNQLCSFLLSLTSHSGISGPHRFSFFRVRHHAFAVAWMTPSEGPCPLLFLTPLHLPQCFELSLKMSASPHSPGYVYPCVLWLLRPSTWICSTHEQGLIPKW